MTNRFRQVKSSTRFVVASLLIGTLTLGCVTTDQGATRGQAAAVGAGLGAALGVVAAHLACGGAAECYALGGTIGAALGGLLGYQYGSHIAGKKREFANQELYLRAVTEEASRVASDAESYNANLSAQIAKLDARKARVERARASAAEKQRGLKSTNEEIVTLLRDSEASLEVIKKEIEVQKHVLAAERETAQMEILQVASVNIADLESQQRSLERSLDRLRTIDRRRAY